jgi:hypothetical protein
MVEYIETRLANEVNARILMVETVPSAVTVYTPAEIPMNRVWLYKAIKLSSLEPGMDKDNLYQACKIPKQLVSRA